MPDKRQNPTLASWLSVLRPRFAEAGPELLALFDTYAAESEFGRAYIDADLRKLRPGSSVLEIGAGSFLLSCQLVREGFAVTSLEPVGEGFSHFDRMREIVLEEARRMGCCPAILHQTAETLDISGCFDYAFSINVMEHVNDVELVLVRVAEALSAGATYRFTCPNYLFPYEPHFNIPTLISKQLTERVLGKQMFENSALPDPVGTWNSLNWISVPQIRKVIRGQHGLKVSFERSMLASTLERMGVDDTFARRRSPAVRKMINLILQLRLHHMARLLPPAMQPIMSCRVERLNPGEKA